MSTVELRLINGSPLYLLADLLLLLLPERCPPWADDGESPLLLLLLRGFFSLTPLCCFSLDLLSLSDDPPPSRWDRLALLESLGRGISSGIGSNSDISLDDGTKHFEDEVGRLGQQHGWKFGWRLCYVPKRTGGYSMCSRWPAGAWRRL